MAPSKKITRSRNGCHPCKKLKIKCDEGKPSCGYCTKKNRKCDYSLVLNWGGRSKGSTKANDISTPIPSSSRTEEHSSIQIDMKPEVIQKSPEIITKLKNDSKRRQKMEIVFNLAKPNGKSSVKEKSSYHEPRIQEINVTREYQRDMHLGPEEHSTTYSTKSYNSDHTLTTLHENKDIHVSHTNKRSRSDNGYKSTKKQRHDYLQLHELIESQIDPFPVSHTSHLFESTALTPVASQLNNNDIANDMEIMSEIGSHHDTVSSILMSPAPSGMEELFDALDEFAYNGVPFQFDSLADSTFLSNPRVNHSETVSQVSHQVNSGFIQKVDNFLVDYKNDIEKLEKYLPKVQTNYNWINKKLIRGGSSSSSESSSENSSSMDPFETFIIPRNLEPLPTLLLEVPFYKNLLHFWVNVSSKQLVPAPHYEDNPFTILLTQMAMEYPSILTVLLAFSAKARSGLLDSNDMPDSVIDQLLARSCSELLIMLRNRRSATSDAALATSMFLSCFELMNSTHDFQKHRAHTIGARQIIKARASLSKRPASVTEQDIANFLVRWFVYVDLIGGLSASKPQNYVLVSDNEQGSYEPLEILNMMNNEERSNTLEEDPGKDIDHLMGFDTKFLPQFMKTVMLIRKVDNYLLASGDSNPAIPLDIIQEALEVKETMLQIYHQDEEQIEKARLMFMQEKSQLKDQMVENSSPPYIASRIQENEILGYTNKVFCDTGIIQLYRRVLKIPRSSPIIQRLATGMATIMRDHIESRSPTEICCIFCFFTAGCEILDPEMQQFFHMRFTRLIKMGNSNAKKGLQVMKRCWETNEDWLTAADNLNIDIILL
ncbi:uncharacterized protein J8A68_001615 [[Candida] subhashii]|uniref:Zn(2)-C6 fungal-type domain-containing protein n=1 Tax=[Candida] subhashii TaxID=561895 RepID=A0A8J5QKQ7_9ASCO|nr:uncharacterized protein J8A68_001615 [[Candida] subhashii]KAG7664857.1 hypothetical protein J8A68_001615 [[Candida] subhashii]